VKTVGFPEIQQIVGKSLMGKAIVYLLTILGQATSFFWLLQTYADTA